MSGRIKLMQDVKIIIDSIINLYRAIGFNNVLWLIAIFYAIYVHDNHVKSKRENLNIDRMEKIYKENIERLADQVKRYESIFLKDVLKLKPEIIEKMTAVQREIKTETEKKEDLNK